jgi:hypothetical protein
MPSWSCSSFGELNAIGRRKCPGCGLPGAQHEGTGVQTGKGSGKGGGRSSLDLGHALIARATTTLATRGSVTGAVRPARRPASRRRRRRGLRELRLARRAARVHLSGRWPPRRRPRCLPRSSGPSGQMVASPWHSRRPGGSSLAEWIAAVEAKRNSDAAAVGSPATASAASAATPPLAAPLTPPAVAATHCAGVQSSDAAT